MDKIERYKEIERRGLLSKLPQEKQDLWAEYKRRHNEQPQEENKLLDALKTLQGGVSSVEKGYSAGFGRKLGGLANAIGGAPVDALLTDKPLTQAIKDRYNEVVQSADEAEKQFSQENPVTSGVLSLAGAVASPINKIGAGLLAKPTSMLSKLGTSVGVGAGTGGIYGLGKAENLEDLPQSVIEDATTGAIIGGALPIAGKALKGAGKLGKEVLGITTGSGGRSVSQAYEAGKRGSKEFIENMRGTKDKADVVDLARNKLLQLKQAKNQEYANSIEALKQDQTKLSLDGVIEKLTDIKKDYNVGGFSKAGKDTQKAINEISKIVSNFAKKPDIHTAEGFDALKQRIYDITFPIEARQANSVVKQVGNAVKNEINKQAPVYSKIMKNYTEASNKVKELEKSLSLRDDKNIDTALRKLQSSFRDNVSSNYGTRGDLVEALGGNQLSDAISGQLMQSAMPRGLVGRAIGAGGVFTQNLPLILASSPRLVGETAYKAGQIANKMPKDINVNPTAVWMSLLGDK